MIRKIFLLYVILITCSSCSEFAILASGTSVAISQNAYARAYSGVDVLMIMGTEKDIKTHTYERVKNIIKKSD
jgi:hypothetical protein